jgi:hypothetical protein
VKKLRAPSPDDLDQPLQDQGGFSFANVVLSGESNDVGADATLWFRSKGSKNLAPPVGNRARANVPSRKPWLPTPAPILGAGQPGARESLASGTDLGATMTNGATAAFDGRSAQSLSLTGTAAAGTVK